LRRPGEPGTPLAIAEGQTVSAIDFVLPRVGVINGRVVDEVGEPIAHVNIWTMQFKYYQGARTLVAVGGPGGHTSTDDSGQYRLFLPPGDFVVMGQIRETWPLESDPTQMFGYPPSFYPGVIAPADAQRIKVGVGEEVGNIDFALVPARTSRVSGTVLNAAGTPVTGESVTLSQEVRGPDMGSVFPSSNAATTGADGRFAVNNVQAGEYVLAVRSAAANDQPAQEARQMIQVAGVDIDGLVIVTGSVGTVRGQVASDDGTPVPGADRLIVRARPLTSATRMSTLGSSGNGRVNADGTFELKALVGPVVLSIGTLTGEWTLKAVELDRRNLADDPIEVRHGETVSGVRVVLTNRPTHLRGGLMDEKQQPVEGTVVIFPEDPSRWREDSRTIRSARPDQHGEFSIKGLPAGNYLIAAIDYVQDGQWYDPEFLADLRPRAVRLSLAEAESKRIDLTVRQAGR
jgi:Carboxypeptidase regulatory-like domain